MCCDEGCKKQAQYGDLCEKHAKEYAGETKRDKLPENKQTINPPDEPLAEPTVDIGDDGELV